MAKIPERDWSSDNLAEALAIFKQTMVHTSLKMRKSINQNKNALKILRGLGAEAIKRLQASGLSEQDKKNPEKLRTFSESQLQININFSVHRLQLMGMRHSEHETLDDFCTRARTTALKCQFEREGVRRKNNGADYSINTNWSIPERTSEQRERIHA